MMDDGEVLAHYQIVIHRQGVWMTQEFWQYEGFTVWKPTRIMRLWYKVMK